MYDSLNGIETDFHGLKKGLKRLHIFWTNSYQNGPLWDGARMQAHPLSVLRGGRVAQASAPHYCAKAALHSVVHWGTQYTSSTVSRLQIPLDRRTVKSIFHCSSKALHNSTVVEGKQLAFICSVALIVNRVRC